MCSVIGRHVFIFDVVFREEIPSNGFNVVQEYGCFWVELIQRPLINCYLTLRTASETVSRFSTSISTELT